MSRVFLAGLFALPLLICSGGNAAAQWSGPNPGCTTCAAPAAAPVPYAHPHAPAPFQNFGCANCVGLFARIHQHGPLFNYGPYAGYYPFEPYGPWTSDLRYNPPVQDCGHGGCGRQSLFSGLHNLSWKKYSCDTYDNVRKRLHPSSIRCGTGDCGSAAATPTAGCAGCSAQIDIPMPAVLAMK